VGPTTDLSSGESPVAAHVHVSGKTVEKELTSHEGVPMRLIPWRGVGAEEALGQ
jgi:hypothetical protein